MGIHRVSTVGLAAVSLWWMGVQPDIWMAVDADGIWVWGFHDVPASNGCVGTFGRRRNRTGAATPDGCEEHQDAGEHEPRDLSDSEQCCGTKSRSGGRRKVVDDKEPVANCAEQHDDDERADSDTRVANDCGADNGWATDSVEPGACGV